MTEQLDQIIHDTIGHLSVDDLNKKESMRIATTLGERYEEPWRAYHNLDHLSSMVGFLLLHKDALEDPSAALWAALGHDSMYVPELYVPTNGVEPGTNERRSEELTRSLLSPYITPERLAKISGHILNTIGHKPTEQHNGKDAEYFLDADIIALGGTPEIFETYDQGIASEFSFVPTDVYRTARIDVLKSFTARNSIFFTQAAQQAYEKVAWNNLTNKIVELEAQAR